MKTKSLGILTVFFFVAMILTGCGFKMKNTEGLQLAYKDIDRASDYASELKAMEKYIPQEKFFKAKDMYIDAKNELNGYLKSAVTNAADYEVNNTKEEYLATKASEKVNAFENEVKGLRPFFQQKHGLAPLVIISAVVPLALEAIKAIMDADQKAKDAGLKVFKETVEKYQMKSFEEIPEGKEVIAGGGKK